MLNQPMLNPSPHTIKALFEIHTVSLCAYFFVFLALREFINFMYHTSVV